MVLICFNFLGLFTAENITENISADRKTYFNRKCLTFSIARQVSGFENLVLFEGSSTGKTLKFGVLVFLYIHWQREQECNFGAFLK